MRHDLVKPLAKLDSSLAHYRCRCESGFLLVTMKRIISARHFGPRLLVRTSTSRLAPTQPHHISQSQLATLVLGYAQDLAISGAGVFSMLFEGLEFHPLTMCA